MIRTQANGRAAHNRVPMECEVGTNVYHLGMYLFQPSLGGEKI
jgi:hypothetical protein